MRNVLLIGSLGVVLLLVTMPAHAGDPTPTPAPGSGPAQGPDLEEVNRQLSNPLSTIWSIPFQQNNYKLEVQGHDDQWNSNLNLQPLMPIDLTKDWSLISRPVFTLFNSVPYPDPHNPTQLTRTTKLGDTVIMEMVGPGPSLVGNWLLGVGATFILPTATSDYTGQGKWQAGPAVMAGYLTKKWIGGVFVQNWTSFSGDSDRPDVNQMNIMPLLAYFLPHRWTVGYSGNITANWEADSGEVWTVPIGVSVGKLVMLGPMPVKFGLAAQYMVCHPSNYGQKWNLQLNITAVIPKLVKGTLF
jgi:hypothetical protein